MDPGTRGSGPPLVSISRRLEQTPIAPGKPLIPVTGTHSATIPPSERGPTTTTQPVGRRDATRSTQESPQVCRPMASAQMTPDQDPQPCHPIEPREGDQIERLYDRHHEQNLHAGGMESRNPQIQRNQLGRSFRGARRRKTEVIPQKINGPPWCSPKITKGAGIAACARMIDRTRLEAQTEAKAELP